MNAKCNLVVFSIIFVVSFAFQHMYWPSHLVALLGIWITGAGLAGLITGKVSVGSKLWPTRSYVGAPVYFWAIGMLVFGVWALAADFGLLPF